MLIVFTSFSEKVLKWVWWETSHSDTNQTSVRTWVCNPIFRGLLKYSPTFAGERWWQRGWDHRSKVSSAGGLNSASQVNWGAQTSRESSEQSRYTFTWRGGAGWRAPRVWSGRLLNASLWRFSRHPGEPKDNQRTSLRWTVSLLLLLSIQTVSTIL